MGDGKIVVIGVTSVNVIAHQPIGFGNTPLQYEIHGYEDGTSAMPQWVHLPDGKAEMREEPDFKHPDEVISDHAAAMGRKAAANMTPEQRQERARKASRARWNKPRPGQPSPGKTIPHVEEMQANAHT
jgi:hypothetical protein